jgi:hypothetical protein
MEAASGGYVEVGRVLLDKGADVNAPPVPSSRDTALTIAADKGHCRFVELLLSRYFEYHLVKSALSVEKLSVMVRDIYFAFQLPCVKID